MVFGEEPYAEFVGDRATLEYSAADKKDVELLRKLWLQQLERGRREGWYQVYVGEVDSVVPGPQGTVVTRIRGGELPGEER